MMTAWSLLWFLVVLFGIAVLLGAAITWTYRRDLDDNERRKP